MALDLERRLVYMIGVTMALFYVSFGNDLENHLGGKEWLRLGSMKGMVRMWETSWALH